MIRKKRTRFVFTLRSMATVLALALLPSSAAAQTYVHYNGFKDLASPVTPEPPPPLPKLAFQLLAEIPLPGPLPGTGPLLEGDLIEIQVAGGTMKTAPARDTSPEFVATPPGDPLSIMPSNWVVNDTGKWRFRSLPSGFLEAQKRCKRCKDGWKRKWRLRVPGNTLVDPLIVDNRIYLGALDNMLYSLKTRNGHRIWTVDIGGRVAAPPVQWRGEVPDPTSETDSRTRELLLILAIPNGGTEMVAVESEHGRTVASLRLPDGGGKLVGGAVSTADGKIVVARQRYIPTEASLMVYGLRSVDPQPNDGR